MLFVMTTNAAPNHVTVFYDPLCGWCYGAGPGFRWLSAQAGVRLELVPTGLFSGAGARPMDAAFAAYAWKNDQRIESLSGQRFTELYRDRVLADRSTKLDSGPATTAVTAAALVDPLHELDALAAIQTARYVEGRDVTATSVLVDILRAHGLEAAASRFSGSDPELLAAVEARTAAARRALAALGAQGVPTVTVGDDAARRVIPSKGLYGQFDELLHHVDAG